LSALNDVNVLKSQGVTHVLQLLDKTCEWIPDISAGKFAVRRVDILDRREDAHKFGKEMLEDLCVWIQRARAGGGGVLVHCQQVRRISSVLQLYIIDSPTQGISRSAAIVIAYLIRFPPSTTSSNYQPHVYSYDAALSMLKSIRACVKPNDGFERVLRGWDQICTEQRRAASTGRPGLDRRWTS